MPKLDLTDPEVKKELDAYLTEEISNRLSVEIYTRPHRDWGDDEYSTKIEVSILWDGNIISKTTDTT